MLSALTSKKVVHRFLDVNWIVPIFAAFMLFEIAEVQLDRYTNTAVSRGLLHTIFERDIITCRSFHPAPTLVKCRSDDYNR